MAKLRKFIAYRSLNRPYTRRSKYRAKSYVKSSPHNRISKYNMGEINKSFTHVLKLNTVVDVQIRDNALESARQVTLRRLEKHFGKVGYAFHIRVFPHHVLRENPLASGAGADRMSTGMKMSFGKTVGIAAQVKEGNAIYIVKCNKKNILKAKEALLLAATKLPCSCKLVIEENEQAKV